jgi:hypothetical protein
MPRIFCLLPAARAHFASTVVAAGGIPVIDLTADPLPHGAALPPGAWVRVRSTESAVPGDAGVLTLSGAPVAGRETWIEVSAGAIGAGAGFAGTCVRGAGSGGRAGVADVRTLGVDAGTSGQMVDWPFGPEGVPARDILLSDVLLGLLEAPAALADRLARLSAADLRVVNGVSLVASLAAPALRRIAAGESPEQVATGLWTDGDAFTHAWLGGAGLLLASGLAERFPSLAALIGAYAAARSAGANASGASASGASAVSASEPGARYPQEPIAIIGIGCRLPGASSAEQLWKRLLEGWSGIIEVPTDRWDPALYWSPDHSVPDKTYSKIGGFITDFTFNPRRFRIPPSTVRLIDVVQQIALEASADALEDAGYGAAKDFDRERVAVILGQSMGGEITDEYAVRAFFPSLRKALSEVPQFSSLPLINRPRSSRILSRRPKPRCRRSPKIPCPASSPTSPPGASPTRSTSAARISPPTRRARGRWPRSRPRSRACRTAILTWRSAVVPTAPWRRPPTRSSPRSGRCPPSVLVRSTSPRTAL